MQQGIVIGAKLLPVHVSLLCDDTTMTHMRQLSIKVRKLMPSSWTIAAFTDAANCKTVQHMHQLRCERCHRYSHAQVNNPPKEILGRPCAPCCSKKILKEQTTALLVHDHGCLSVLLYRLHCAHPYPLPKLSHGMNQPIIWPKAGPFFIAKSHCSHSPL